MADISKETALLGNLAPGTRFSRDGVLYRKTKTGRSNVVMEETLKTYLLNPSLSVEVLEENKAPTKIPPEVIRALEQIAKEKECDCEWDRGSGHERDLSASACLALSALRVLQENGFI